MNSRLAVFGGMFDPVHNGHVEAAQFAFETLFVDCLKMIPCHRPNHKKDAQTEARHRLAMLELVTSDYPHIGVDPIELNKNKVSYTVDTLSELKQKHSSLVFVLGVDSFNSLPQWHQWERLLELSHLMVLARPGSSLSENTKTAVSYQQRQVNSSEELLASNSGRIIYSEDFDFDIASSSVRQKLMQGANVSAELDARVITYVMNNKLYQ